MHALTVLLMREKSVMMAIQPMVMVVPLIVQKKMDIHAKEKENLHFVLVLVEMGTK